MGHRGNTLTKTLLNLPKLCETQWGVELQQALGFEARALAWALDVFRGRASREEQQGKVKRF